MKEPTALDCPDNEPGVGGSVEHAPREVSLETFRILSRIKDILSGTDNIDLHYTDEGKIRRALEYIETHLRLL